MNQELASALLARGQPWTFPWGRVAPEGAALLRIESDLSPGNEIMVPVAAVLLVALGLLGLVGLVRSLRARDRDWALAFPGMRLLSAVAVVGSLVLLRLLIHGGSREVTRLDLAHRRVEQERVFWGFRASSSCSFDEVEQLRLAEQRVRSPVHRKFLIVLRLRSGEERSLLSMFVPREKTVEAEDLHATLGRKTGWALAREDGVRLW